MDWILSIWITLIAVELGKHCLLYMISLAVDENSNELPCILLQEEAERYMRVGVLQYDASGVPAFMHRTERTKFANFVDGLSAEKMRPILVIPSFGPNIPLEVPPRLFPWSSSLSHMLCAAYKKCSWRKDRDLLELAPPVLALHWGDDMHSISGNAARLQASELTEFQPLRYLVTMGMPVLPIKKGSTELDGMLGRKREIFPHAFKTSA